MRVAQVAPLYESVPPARYGGTERVVSYLTEELVRRGHRVTLFASGDSLTTARLVRGSERALRLDPRRVDALAAHVRLIGAVYERASEFDIIHCHVDHLALPLTRFVDTPTVITHHGRLDIPGLAELYGAYPEVPLVSVSHAQRGPLAGVNWVGTVHHGLPRDRYTFHPSGGGYLVFLGRISPEKCPDAAIRVAVRAGLRLKIAAKVDRVDREYFEARVRPLLDHPLVEYLGEVDDRDKDDLLGGALALIFPVDWPEPFGLVVIEALACGTPVIARRRGSVPELLRDGVTGILCETEEDMVRAVARVGALDRAACRAEFERRFSVEAMTDRYLEIYRELVAARRPAGLPRKRRRAATGTVGAVAAAPQLAARPATPSPASRGPQVL